MLKNLLRFSTVSCKFPFPFPLSATTRESGLFGVLRRNMNFQRPNELKIRTPKYFANTSLKFALKFHVSASFSRNVSRGGDQGAPVKAYHYSKEIGTRLKGLKLCTRILWSSPAL